MKIVDVANGPACEPATLLFVMEEPCDAERYLLNFWSELASALAQSHEGPSANAALVR